MMDLVKKYKEVPGTMVFGIVCLYFIKPFNKKPREKIKVIIEDRKMILNI